MCTSEHLERVLAHVWAATWGEVRARFTHPLQRHGYSAGTHGSTDASRHPEEGIGIHKKGRCRLVSIGKTLAGWWFGCHFLFSHILGIKVLVHRVSPRLNVNLSGSVFGVLTRGPLVVACSALSD